MLMARIKLLTLYRALQNKDIAQILAQPRLVVKNGKSGGFLSGGEVPIITTTANTFGVIYKPFGVRLTILFRQLLCRIELISGCFLKSAI